MKIAIIGIGTACVARAIAMLSHEQRSAVIIVDSNTPEYKKLIGEEEIGLTTPIVLEPLPMMPLRPMNTTYFEPRGVIPQSYKPKHKT